MGTIDTTIPYTHDTDWYRVRVQLVMLGFRDVTEAATQSTPTKHRLFREHIEGLCIDADDPEQMIFGDFNLWVDRITDRQGKPLRWHIVVFDNCSNEPIWSADEDTVEQVLTLVRELLALPQK